MCFQDKAAEVVKRVPLEPSLPFGVSACFEDSATPKLLSWAGFSPGLYVLDPVTMRFELIAWRPDDLTLVPATTTYHAQRAFVVGVAMTDDRAKYVLEINTTTKAVVRSAPFFPKSESHGRITIVRAPLFALGIACANT